MDTQTRDPVSVTSAAGAKKSKGNKYWRIVDALAWHLGKNASDIKPHDIRVTAHGSEEIFYPILNRTVRTGWPLSAESQALRTALMALREHLRDGNIVAFQINEDGSERQFHPTFWNDKHLLGELVYFDKGIVMHAASVRSVFRRARSNKGGRPTEHDWQRIRTLSDWSTVASRS